jgi:hypothetical protein
VEVKTQISPELQSAIVGMVLGDASLIRVPSGNGYLQFRHATRQKQYALYKADLLRQITHVNVLESDGYVDSRTGKAYPFINVRTRQHPLYARMREAFYPTSHKVVDPFWLRKLDERGLALWYFDDGTSKEYHCYLATLAFSWPENHLIAKYLWERFELHADVRQWAKGKPIIRIPSKARQQLRNILSPFAEAAGLESKLPNVHPPRGYHFSFPKAGKPRGWYPSGEDHPSAQWVMRQSAPRSNPGARQK